MITQRNIQDESFDSMTVNGIPALFTNFRIDRNVVPEGLHAYDIRESDDGRRFATIEPEVMVNHAGNNPYKRKAGHGRKRLRAD